MAICPDPQRRENIEGFIPRDRCDDEVMIYLFAKLEIWTHLAEAKQCAWRYY